MGNELLTDYQKKKIARDNAIVAKFNDMKKRYPNASNNRIFGTMAKDTYISAQGIRMLLIRRGVVKVRQRVKRAESRGL